MARKQRLVDTLPILEQKDLAEESNIYGNPMWVPAALIAKQEKVSVATIYNRIGQGKIIARNFMGRIFIYNPDKGSTNAPGRKNRTK